MNKHVRISLLIKISEEKYIDKIQQEGEFFCNSLSYFRELENDGYKYDPNEGRQFVKQVKNFKIFKGDREIISAKSAQIFLDKFYSGNIFCFYGLHTSKLDLNNQKLQKINIEIESDRLGQYALLIFNIAAFKERLKKKFKELNMKYDLGPVKYLNLEEYEGELNPFTKSHVYKNQSETRIWIPRAIENQFTFYLGNISDISYKCRIEDLDKLETKVLK